MSAAKENTKSINRSLLTVVVLLLVVVIWIGIRLVFPDSPTILAGTRPDNLGIREGKLLPCPTTPNCVSSQSTDLEHSIVPLTYQSSATDAIAQGAAPKAIANLKSIIQSQERAKIIAETDNYLYAEFASRWMGFVDDVEFYANEATGKIDVRSASRLGESDLGVNRQRVESIRDRFKAK